MKAGSDNGYTLVEVLVALVLLFIVLTPTTFVISKLMTVADIEDRIIANRICINKMEELLLGEAPEFAMPEQIVIIDGRRYHIRQKLEELPNALRLLKLTVSRHSRTLATLHHVLPGRETLP